MKQEFTKIELEKLMVQLNDVFETVTLEPVDEADVPEVLENKGVSVDHLLDNSSCAGVLTRHIKVDGVWHVIQMSDVITCKNDAPHNMSEREQQIYNDDLIRDFLSGAYNRTYWETKFCASIASHVAAKKNVAVAIISIDDFAAIEEKYGVLDTDQLVCYVANQWKKFYDEGDEKVVCRISKSTFAVGCVGATSLDLESQMRYLYEQMNLVCTATCGMLCRIPFTLSVACASTDEVCNPNWAELQILCEARLNSFKHTGGNGVAYAELR